MMLKPAIIKTSPLRTPASLLRAPASSIAAAGLIVSSLFIPASTAQAKVVTGGDISPQAVERISECQNRSTLTIVKRPRNPYSDPPPGLQWPSVEGQVFRVQRVSAIDLTTNAGWAKAQKLSLTQLSDEAFDWTGTATTDSDGRAAFGAVPMGIYLVEQTSIPGDGYVKDVTPRFAVAVPIGTMNGDGWNCSVEIDAKTLPANTESDEKDKGNDGDDPSSRTRVTPTPDTPDSPGTDDSTTPNDDPDSPGGSDASGGSGSDSGTGAQDRGSDRREAGGLRRLPMTGANVIALMSSGAVLMLVGFWLIVARRRRSSKDSTSL